MNQPPKWMTKFLRWYCRTDLADGIEGDLFELYQRRVSKYGSIRAGMLYFLNTLLFFQPFAFRNKSAQSRLTPIDMFRNYLTIAKRSLIKYRSTTLINVLGLAIGISSFILMITYVIDELSYDQFHTKSDRIVRAVYSYEARGTQSSIARISFPLKKHMLDNYPEVESVVRFYRNKIDVTTLKYGEKLFTEEKVYFVDPEVFQVFDFKLLAGNPETALTDKYSIVISEQAAIKYFGKENPIGKTLIFKNNNSLEVTGVVEKRQSHLDFDFLVPVELQRSRWMGGKGNNGYDLEKDWKWSGAWTYVLLKDASSKNAFDDRFNEDGKDLFGRVENPSVEYSHSSQSLRDIHLKSDLISEIGINGSIKQVYGFGVVAFLILIIACLNFINLTTAQSTNRAKEIGLRKVMGAHKKSLIGQFITEAVMITLISTILSLFLLELMVPLFNTFMGKQLSIPYFEIPILMLLIFIGALIIGVLAGAYPSFYLSRLKPVKTLKGNYTGNRSNTSLRKFFVIGQFIVSNILIAGIIVVQMQMDFVKGKSLGFDKDQTIIMAHGTKIDDEFNLFRSQLVSSPFVENVVQGYVAGTGGWVQSFRVDGENLEEAKSMGFKNIGYDFVDMFGLEMALGRNFSRKFGTDSSNAILLNEAAVKAFGWTNEEALTKTFSWTGGNDNKTEYSTKVIGIMRDANFESLYEPVKPSVFKLNFFGDVAIKFKTSNTSDLLTAIDQVEEVWSEIAPNWPFEFAFLDQEIEAQYKQDESLGQMIQFFAFLAIFIACMGLFGLAAFTVKKRTKEIGVRKVLGAGVGSIIFVIMKGFLVLVTISFFVSVPIGYYVSQNWLQNFAYRIELNPVIFLASGIISIVIAGFAIISQSYAAARLDPVETLKDE